MMSSLSFAFPENLSCTYEDGLKMEIKITEKESYISINDYNEKYEVAKGAYFYVFANKATTYRGVYRKSTIMLDVAELYVTFTRFIAVPNSEFKITVNKGTCIVSQVL